NGPADRPAGLAIELGYDARRPVDHPTPFEPTECFKLIRKGSMAKFQAGMQKSVFPACRIIP
ncbi:hypothetical protein ACCS78_08560, partial [Rhizobium johnstonii]